ncbi:phage baseplate assembly protein V, partial [Helicobacter sp. 14348-15]|uniref:bacteriophage T4 gp5 trimerisation domain-containing protein n=1 Tax=Helicobacter colisuis TaxID=2949739 RepID=UPI00202B210E
VSSPIASNHSGFYHTPRIGDEVIISFLDEDIDKPYISSSLYNGTTTMPQYNYPRYKREIASSALASLSAVPTMINKGLEELKLQENTDYSLSPTNNHYLTLANATIGTDNVEAKARNEITLKNDKDKEEIYILAQKDYKEEIGNNYEQTIKHNKTSEVGALYTEFITLGHMQNIVGFKNVNVGAEYLENTLLSKDTNVGLSNTLNIGVDNKLRVARNSSEYVGRNKDIEIRGNQNAIIHKDENRNVKGNKEDILEGSWDIKSHKDINISSQSNYSLSTDDNIDFYSKDSIKLSSAKQTTLNNQDLLIDTDKQTIIKANEKIQLSIGEAIIQSDGKEIVFKVGSAKITLKNGEIIMQGKVSIRE